MLGRSCYRAGTRALRSALTRLDLARARSGRLIGAFSQCGELLSPHSELFADLGSYGDLRQLAPSLGLLSKEAGIGHRRIPAAVLFNNYQHPAAAFVFALKPRSDAPAGEPADDTRLQAKRFQERPMQFRRRRCRRSGTLAFSSRYLSGGAPTVHVTRSSGAE